MIESNSTESHPFMNVPERNVEDEPEVHDLTQEGINEQITNHIDRRLTHQLEGLTRMIQRMTSTQHPTSYARAGTIASFSSPDISLIAHSD